MLSNAPDLLKINDLCNILEIGKGKAYEMIRNNEIKSMKIGKLIRIPKWYLIDYLEKKCDTMHSNGRQNCANAVIV